MEKYLAEARAAGYHEEELRVSTASSGSLHPALWDDMLDEDNAFWENKNYWKEQVEPMEEEEKEAEDSAELHGSLSLADLLGTNCIPGQRLQSAPVLPHSPPVNASAAAR